MSGAPVIIEAAVNGATQRERFPEALLYPTMTGGGPHTTVEQRYGHIPAIAAAGVLTMGIVDPGSVNLGWLEPDGTPAPTEIVYINSLSDIRHMFTTCAGLGVPVNISIFDDSFMRTAVAYAKAGGIPHGATIGRRPATTAEALKILRGN